MNIRIESCMFFIFVISISVNNFADGFLESGSWHTEGTGQAGRIELCVSNETIFFKREKNGKSQEFSVSVYNETIVDDLFILNLDQGSRTIFKLVAVKRGRSDNLELVGSLHFYLEGLVHLNSQAIRLIYSGTNC